MSLLVDTSFLVAVKSLGDAAHSRAVELFQEILRGEHGATHTTDFVFAEAVTVALARTRRHSAAVGVGEFVLRAGDGHPFFLMHHVTPDELLAAWEEFRRYRDRGLSMVDWTSVIVARNLEADAILSFDEGFDGVYHRLS